jgi:uncharacterized protein
MADTPPFRINILSMDGGNGLNTAQLLTQLEDVDRMGFLDRTNVFTGTSAGGINSLFFATAKSPTAALSDLQGFWMQVNEAILAGLETPEGKQLVQNYQAAAASAGAPAFGPQDLLRVAFGLSLAAVGLRSLFVNDPMKAILLQRFGDMRLGDIADQHPNRAVVIVSFQLDDQTVNPADPSSDDHTWRAKLYTNLPRGHVSFANGVVTDDPNPDIDERVVDVAMRTSAAPLELPIYQSLDGSQGGPGFVDGGLVANNPCMLTLAAIVGTLIHVTGLPPSIGTSAEAAGALGSGSGAVGGLLSKIWMLSVGTGRNLIGTAQYLAPEFTDGSAAWGYQKWLFDLSNPLVLIDAFLQGGNETAAFQSGILLGDSNFNRLNVPLKFFLVDNSPFTKAAVANSAAWLRQPGGWMAGGPTLVPALTSGSHPERSVRQRSEGAHGRRLRSRV